MIIAAVLVATALDHAGRPAALLRWDDELTLVEFQVEQLRHAGVDPIEVVVGPDAERLVALVAADDVEPIVSARWQDSITAALRAGASAVPRDTPAAVVALVEEPRPASAYRTLLDAHLDAAAELTVPTHDGRRGRPVVCGFAALAALRNLTDERGLDALAERIGAGVREVAWPDDSVLRSVRNEADCAAARATIAHP